MGRQRKTSDGEETEREEGDTSSRRKIRENKFINQKPFKKTFTKKKKKPKIDTVGRRKKGVREESGGLLAEEG